MDGMTLKGETVWSSDGSHEDNKRLRKQARGGKQQRGGKAKPAKRRDPADGVLRVRREKSGRGGKTVTTVTGLRGDLPAQAKRLKQLCGSGGRALNGVVEIQGDHVDKLIAHFEAAGHRAKRAGG